jgi:REP element-mobilizing transposase RayT
LPHFDDGRQTQFVTDRLADSLPSSALDRQKTLLDHGKITERDYHAAVDKYLDNGYGECLLARPEIAELVIENLTRHAGVRYQLHAWVIMPNHVHLLFTGIDGRSLSEIMHGFKSYTAHEINRRLDRTGHVWSKEYFDRYIRDGMHFRNAARYIERNPVKAGLCRSPEDWPFSSAAR